jgi:hypothetical protein
VYVDIAGWHLFMRDMNAVPGFKMSSALATKLGPEVCVVMTSAESPADSGACLMPQHSSRVLTHGVQDHCTAQDMCKSGSLLTAHITPAASRGTSRKQGP